jgi:hypothetical protein
LIAFHAHRPQPTGVRISAGYRKNNLPVGAYVAYETGQLWVCACTMKFIESKNGGLIELENEGALAQYDRAGIN